jgi:hypothetical protein
MSIAPFSSALIYLDNSGYFSNNLVISALTSEIALYHSIVPGTKSPIVSL